MTITLVNGFQLQCTAIEFKAAHSIKATLSDSSAVFIDTATIFRIEPSVITTKNIRKMLA